jgi:hypothetical protein
MTEHNLPDKDDAPWLDTTYDGFMTHEEMLEVAERRELANKTFEELTKDERIKLALEEIDWIVIGGQDGEEFYGSIQFLRKVLRSLRTHDKLAHETTTHPRDAL